ncbi:MAG TPA: hypothetical protein ENI85_03825 [Deltaproteobacteria bacterium]|nr:hypothetical protein [Deltaproteobacteria bacterium]
MDPIGKAVIPTVQSLGHDVGRNVDEKTALRAFDAYFLGEMLRRSAPKETGSGFDGGQAGRMYRDHLYQELARLIAENGDFGLAASLEGKLADEKSDGAGGAADPAEGDGKEE